MLVLPGGINMTRFDLESISNDDPLGAIEFCYRMGWSDGLPVVPPTESRVREFLDYVGRESSDVVLVEPVAGRVVTAEKAAANAVMAGCLPEYFPVVLAALTGMGESAFNLHGATLSTSGMAVMAIVNGPIARELGMNAGTALFCPGTRANSTIGRALFLVMWNCTGNRPDELDRTIFGHGGRYSMCISEREEDLPNGWEPLHVDRGFHKSSNAVTVLTAGLPISGGGGSDSDAILKSIVDKMTPLQPLNKGLLMVMTPEVMRALYMAGWTKSYVKEYLYKETGRPASDYTGRKLTYTAPERISMYKGTDMVPTLERPEALDIVVAGGDGGASVMIIEVYGTGVYSASITTEIKTGSK